MSGDNDFITTVVGALSRALTPLIDATASPDALGVLLNRLGWTTPPPQAVVDEVATVSGAIAQLADDVAGDASTPTLVADVVQAVRAVAGLDQVIVSTGGAPFDSPDFWRSLPEDVIGLLLCDDLRAYSPGFYGLLSFIGVVHVESRRANAETGRAAYDANVIDWTVLGRTAASPTRWLADVYGWDSHFDHDRFLAALADLAFGLGVIVRRIPPHRALIAPYMAPDNPDRVRVLAITPFVMPGATLNASIKPSLLVLPVPPSGDRSAVPDGLLIRPMITGSAQTRADLGPSAALTLEGDFQVTPVVVRIHPSRTIVEHGSTGAAASARVDIEPSSPFVMVGTTAGSRLELARAHLLFEVNGSTVTLEAGLDEAAAIVSLGSADGFLRGVMGDGSVSVPVSGAMTWSSVSGVHFSGNAVPRLTLPVNLRIANIITVTEVQIELGADEDRSGTRLTVAIDGSFNIGPITFLAQDLGLALALSPRTLAHPGNFGPLDIALAFKPPTGLGIGIDVEGIITGGGFLWIDDGHYAGGAALQMFGVGLTVIGIVQTELPGNPEGWSVFLSVIADFTPVPLGFGFVLSGVGGFMGLHRTLDEVALGAGVRDGRIDSLLFPEDPLADAMRILSDIDAFFPALEGTHAFGAMARIGWGVPALISGELGIVLVVPDFRIAVLGEIESILPSAQAPLIELHMGVLGYIDPAEATFWVAASIYDSRLVQYALSGDMAMYASLGDRPYFLLSVGGYHPHWRPPASVPSTMRGLRRMTAAIDLGEDLQIGLEAYFAITSNTLQFGANVFAVAAARELGVDFRVAGSFGFDALVTFAPFSILATMRARVGVRVEGETLFSTKVKLRLEGPKPWYGRATASFEYLGVPVSFSVSAGGSIAPDAPDTVDVWPALEQALRDVGNWTVPASAPATVRDVTLRPLDPMLEPGAWLEPDGVLEVRQRVVPLNRTIDLFGEYVPSGESRFTVESAGLAEGLESEWTPIEDWFAPAQFIAMTPDEQLSAPSFEEMDAGVTLITAGVDVPQKNTDLASVALEYQELLLDEETTTLGTRALTTDRFVAALPAAVSTRPVATRRRVTGMTAFSVASPRYRIVDAVDATPVAALGTGRYADALVTRRRLTAGLPTRPRIVPVQAVQERAA
jgi:hypothetical protein